MRLAVAILAYLVGSIPFGYLVARLVRGIDIREHGSHNIGATNVGRVLGTRFGLLVLLLDALKGAIPVLVLPRLLIGAEAKDVLHWSVAAGIATVLGHMFPLYLGLRGGKGVATALGVAICLAPIASGYATVIFLFAFFITRWVSLASMLAAIGYGVCEMVTLKPTPFANEHWSVGLFSLLVPCLIVFRHRANIGRIWRGEEPRYLFRKPAVADAGSIDSKAGQSGSHTDFPAQRSDE